MAAKDYKAILARYHFTDDHGHSLERVTDYLDLLAELERLRKEAKADEYSPQIEERIRKNLTPRKP